MTKKDLIPVKLVVNNFLIDWLNVIVIDVYYERWNEATDILGITRTPAKPLSLQWVELVEFNVPLDT